MHISAYNLGLEVPMFNVRIQFAEFFQMATFKIIRNTYFFFPFDICHSI